MRSDEQPLFMHDCDACVFLGAFEGNDLYFCSQQRLGVPTVIARHGSGGAYRSGMQFANLDPSLHEARSRAMARGLISPSRVATEER